MSDNQNKIIVKDADVVVSGIRDITEHLRYISQSNLFISHPVQDINDRILSFVYQCKKMKPEDLKQCTRGSIAEAFKTSLEVGLPVNAYQLAYLTKYGKELTYHIGYKGYLYKIRQLRKGAYVEVHLLWPEDEFSYQSQSGRAEYTYKPAKAVRADFGNVTGGFVYMAWSQNGREYSCVHTMSRQELDEAKRASKAKNGPWNNWPGEMMKKVILRRACKLEFIGDPEMERIIEIDNKEYDHGSNNTQLGHINYAEAIPLDSEQSEPLKEVPEEEEAEVVETSESEEE